MSKILFGAGVADARNALGGHVFSKNRNGAYLRMKVSPTQPRSPKQLAVRASFGTFAKAWGGILTDLQRASWTALAATNPVPDQFGNPQVLTGLQMYQKVNRNLHTIGAARLDTAPANLTATGLSTLSLVATFAGPTIAVTFTPAPLPANHHLILTMTPELSAGKSFFTPFLKLVFADTAAATASPHATYAAWSAIFGALVVGQKIGVSAYTINDTNGAASTPTGASTITV